MKDQRSSKKISVVVPTHNQAEYLGTCLDSVWFQDYPDIQLIVVADPSSDRTSAVLAGFRRAVSGQTVDYAARLGDDGTVVRRTHPRYRSSGRELVIVENETRMGHTASYNQGFGLATGEYVTYVASDDICHPQMLSTLAEPLAAGRADFVYSDMFIVDDDMRILREFRLPDYSFEKSFCDWYLCGVSKLYRRSLHEEHGYFDEAYVANDHECYLRFALGGARFLHVPLTLYSVRDHGGRERGVHARQNRVRLFEESATLVRKARAALAGV